MKRAYPAIKFVRPRSTGGGKSAESSVSEKCSPPPLVAEKVTVSPLLVKRKRPRTQQPWKGPRRRLDPPSPFEGSRPKGTAGSTDEFQRQEESRESQVAALPEANVSNRSQKRQTSNRSAPITVAGRFPASKARRRDNIVEVPPSPNRDALATPGRDPSKALVMVAETPAKHEGRLSSSRSRTTFDVQGIEAIGGLRIPDTPDPKTQLKIEKRPDINIRGVRGDKDDGANCSSSLSSPLGGFCSALGQGCDTCVGGTEVVPVVGACSKPPSCTGDSDARSASNLLQSYAMGAKVKSQQPMQIVARDGFQNNNDSSSRSRGSASGGGSSNNHDGGSAVGGCTRGQSDSEEWDTGSESPDLLRDYASVGTSVLDKPKEVDHTAKRASDQQFSRVRGGSYRIPRRTGRGGGLSVTHQEQQDVSAESGHSLKRSEAADGPRPRPEQISVQQALTRLDTRHGQEKPLPPPCSLDLKPRDGAQEHTVPHITTNLPSSLFTPVGHGRNTGGEMRGVSLEGNPLCSEVGSGSGVCKKPAERRDHCGEGTLHKDSKKKEGGSSAASRSCMLPTTGVGRTGSEARESRGVPLDQHLRKFSTQSVAMESTAGREDTRGNRGCLQMSDTRRSTLNTGRTTGQALAVRQAPPTVKPQLASGPATQGSRIAATRTSFHEGKQPSALSKPRDASHTSAGVPNPVNPVDTTLPLSTPGLGFSGMSNLPHATGSTLRSPTPSGSIPQTARCSTKADMLSTEDPQAQMNCSHAESDLGGSSDGGCTTPPEIKFQAVRQQLYKNPRPGTAGRGRRGRGTGRSWGRGAGRGGKHGSTAPRPAHMALVGVWRTEPAKRKGERGTRSYITLSGQRLTGKEAFRASEEDEKAVKRGLGPASKDRSMIMRIGQGGQPDSDEKYLHEDALKLGTYGIPEQLVESYARRGIRSLFRWQAHCLRVDNGKPLAGGNLVYSAPTSGGKTLVAELLLLRALLKHSGTMALLVVPYVALAIEKRDYLRDVWSPLQLNVQAYHGGEGDDDNGMDGVNVAICTMEKANSIVNRLAEEKRLQALSSVVVDEMHLIGDTSRGFLLELMLTKQRLLCPLNAQLICLSATLPNIESLAKWLGASLYRTQYRPVELRHFVCQSRVVYRPSGVGGSDTEIGSGGQTLERVVRGEIKKVGGTSPISDPDGVVDLVKDALARDLSVLVFCSTKKWCQQTANLLAKEVLLDRQSRTSAKGSTFATGKKNYVNDRGHNGRGWSNNVPSVGGFVRAKSVASAGTDAAATGTEVRSRDREGTSTAEHLGAATTAAASPTATESSMIELRRRTPPTAAETVRERLRQTPVGLDPALSYLVSAGIAFHHSGLVVEERSILEASFRQGSIRVLVATSTLAAGVNLPAHRVIIRSPSIGNGMLDSTRYHQMAGRSGRVGVSRGKQSANVAQGTGMACGESFLILPVHGMVHTVIDALAGIGRHKRNVKFSLSDASRLISAPLPELRSALKDAKGGGLERALLEVVVSKTVTSKEGARRFCSNTLLAAQILEEVLHKACDSAMAFLLQHSFIVQSGGSGEGCTDYEVAPTQLGRAAFFSGLSPSAAVDVFHSLDKACQSFAVASELHALFLVTPLEGIEPNWERFREEYLACSEEDPVRVVGELIGIELGVLVSAAGHSGPKYGSRHYDISRGRAVDLQPYRRFYGAMLLQQAVEEVPVRNMATRLGIDRGSLQALQKEASVFCGMVVCFCRHLQWHELANVLHSFQDRLGYSAKPELLPLVRLSRDLPPFRARALREAGYLSPVELATAEAASVAHVFLRCVPFRRAGWDESVERHRTRQAVRLAENVIRLARAEVVRQLRHQLLSSGSAVEVA